MLNRIIAIIETLTVCLNWIIDIIWQYFKQFECVQVNEFQRIEQLVLKVSTYDHNKQTINIKLNNKR